MYVFMYFDPDTIPVEDHFTDAKKMETYKKISAAGTVQKYFIGFSYIISRDYELDQRCNDTELSKN